MILNHIYILSLATAQHESYHNYILTCSATLDFNTATLQQSSVTQSFHGSLNIAAP